jgi:hypothetical protein
MDKSTHFIREQDVDLLWLHYGGHLSEAESRMGHGLPLTVSARPVVRRAVLNAGSPACDRALFSESGVDAASRTVHSQDLAMPGDRDHHVSPRFPTRRANCLHTVTHGVLMGFHKFPAFLKLGGVIRTPPATRGEPVQAPRDSGLSGNRWSAVSHRPSRKTRLRPPWGLDFYRSRHRRGGPCVRGNGVDREPLGYLL